MAPDGRSQPRMALDGLAQHFVFVYSLLLVTIKLKPSMGHMLTIFLRSL